MANEINELIATLNFVIANYMYPEMRHPINEQTTHPKVNYTIGMHPHKIFHCNQFPTQPLLDKLHNLKCVRIGEIGLDYTITCRCKEHKI